MKNLLYGPLWFLKFAVEDVFITPLRLLTNWSDDQWREVAVPILGSPIIFVVSLVLTILYVNPTDNTVRYLIDLVALLIGWLTMTDPLSDNINMGVAIGLDHWLQGVFLGLAIGIWF